MYLDKKKHRLSLIYEDKYNISTTFPPLSEVKSLCWVSWLHAAFNYYTASSPYTTPAAYWAYLIVPIRMKAETELVYHSGYKAWTHNPNFMD